MRYLTFGAEYMDFPLKDDFNKGTNLEQNFISKDLLEDVQLWNEKYKKIIPLSQEERLLKIDEIEILDKEGLNFLKLLEKDIKENVKIRYYSEGKQVFLRV